MKEPVRFSIGAGSDSTAIRSVSFLNPGFGPWLETAGRNWRNQIEEEKSRTSGGNAYFTWFGKYLTSYVAWLRPVADVNNNAQPCRCSRGPDCKQSMLRRRTFDSEGGQNV
jgi:hypothetical protein